MSESPHTPISPAQQLRDHGVPEHALYLFDWSAQGLGELIPKLGIHFLELTPQQAVATMPVAGNTQPVGLLHGGASAALAETLGSLAAGLAAESGKIAVGTELNISHLRPAVSGLVTATARAARIGRTQCVHTVEIVDPQGKLISIGRITNAIIDRPSPGSVPGHHDSGKNTAAEEKTPTLSPVHGSRAETRRAATRNIDTFRQ